MTLLPFLLLSAAAAAPGNGSLAHPWRPNIVLFLQDDQDEMLGGWGPMRQAEALVASQGARARNFFIHTPVCCPSRAELLTGRYFHNVRMAEPKPEGCMHVDVEKVNPFSFAAHLEKAGYTAGWFGKHLNTCPDAPPPGFRCSSCRWFANGGGNDLEPGAYLNASFSDFEGGVPLNSSRYHSRPGVYVADTNGEYAGYATSVVGNKSVEWLRKVGKGPQPFFLAVAPKAPHVPSTPAPWYASAFAEMHAPRTPGYNATKEELKGHHWLIAQQGPITKEEGEEIDALFRERWRTLLSVDDAIAGVAEALKEMDLVNSTYVFITSDHGYNLGQHRLPSCKLNVYDHDIRIPFVAAGPGIPAGSAFEQAASNVDIAPTIVGLAGLDGFALTPPMDGRSTVPLLIRREGALPSTRQHLAMEEQRWGRQWRTAHLVEYHSLGNVVRTGHLVDDPVSNSYRALRFTQSSIFAGGGLLFAEFTHLEDWNFTDTNFLEVFDMEKDLWQLRNLAAGLPAGVKAKLHAELQARWRCQGLGCEHRGDESLLLV